jgi:hypothetical protein
MPVPLIGKTMELAECAQLGAITLVAGYSVPFRTSIDSQSGTATERTVEGHYDTEARAAGWLTLVLHATHPRCLSRA